jgi:hypothetical protein
VPELAKVVDAGQIGSAVPEINPANWDMALSGQPHMWDDYAVGEKIDHVDGMTVEEADHMIATRLYQNTAKGALQPAHRRQGPLRPAADLWRARHLDWRVAERSMGWPTRFTWRRSMAGGMWRRCLLETRSMLGARFWIGQRSLGVMMWARRVCGWWPPRTVLATTFR